MNVLYYCAGDKDDYIVLTLIITLCLQNKINLLGIICEDAFLSINQNISMTNFWIYKQLKYYNVQIYKGIERKKDLQINNSFPSIWSSSFVDQMVIDYGYNVNDTYTYKNLDELYSIINQQTNNSINILTCSNMTTLDYMLNTMPSFENKIIKITSMIGNYLVPGNIENEGLNVNSEYNSFLDPNAFNSVLNKMYSKMTIAPLDTTRFVPLTKEAINNLQNLGIIKGITNNAMFNIFINILKTSISTVDVNIYMWNSVTFSIFCNLNIYSIYIKPHVTISPFGKIESSTDVTSANPNLYININTDQFWNAISDLFVISNPSVEYVQPGKFPNNLKTPNQPNNMNKRVCKNVCGSSHICYNYNKLLQYN